MNKINIFIKQTKGVLLIPFAIIFFSIASLFAIAIDGAVISIEKSRLNDAVRQAVYAVSATGWSYKDNKDALDEIIDNYLTYYMPNEKPDSVLHYMEQQSEHKKVYSLFAHYNVGISPLSKLGISGFSGDSVRVSSAVDSGIVEVTEHTIPPADYVFAIDFSGSMNFCEGAGDTDCTDKSKLSRLEMIADVVDSIGHDIFENSPGSTIGFVPFSEGVPVWLSDEKKDVYNKFACSYISPFQDSSERMGFNIKNIDWGYWYNKSKEPRKSGYISTRDKDFYNKDIYEYFKNVIAPANGHSQDAESWLLSSGICKKLDKKEYLYCDLDSKSNVNIDNNYENNKIYSKDYFSYTYQENSFASVRSNGSNPILQVSYIDSDKLVNGDFLFKSENVNNIINILDKPSRRPFGTGCYSALAKYKFLDGYNDNINYSGEMEDSDIVNFIKDVKKTGRKGYYLIEPSSDVSVLDEFKNILGITEHGISNARGSTNVMSGFLRAVPMAAQGSNSRKVIFVLTDGIDTTAEIAQNSAKDFRDELLKNKGLCKHITNGLKIYSSNAEAKEGEIYYISLIDNDENNEDIKYWEDNCVGKGNAILATDKEVLKNIIGNIVHKNTIKFVNSPS